VPTGYLLSNPVSNFANLDLTAGSAARGQALSPWSITTETSPITVQAGDFHGNSASIADTY
jgi:hypothetical protein